jgi:hypothetical protein
VEENNDSRYEIVERVENKAHGYAAAFML